MIEDHEIEIEANMQNKLNHIKLWFYQKMGFGWSAHWSHDGKLLAVYYLPPKKKKAQRG